MMNIDVKNDPRLNILNIANKLGIKIIKPTAGSKKVIALCPFCNDSSGHLYLTIENGRYYNVYQCVKCGNKGSGVSLYAKMRGIDTKAAFFEIINEDSNINLIKLSNQIVETQDKKEGFEPKPIHYLNKVYESFLDLLPLYEYHRENLMNRGLFENTINSKKYRSIPDNYNLRQDICLKLIRKYGNNTLEGVSGFYINRYNKWDFCSPAGMLIPSRNISREIQGFQIRFDKPKNKKKRYKNFSSAGFYKGTKCIPHVHVAWNTKEIGKRVVITEGPLKADIATQFTNITFLALPGIGALHSELVSILKEMMPYQVDIAADMDILDKIPVQIALNNLKQRLNENSFKYTEKRWENIYLKNKDIKGVDDYLLYLYKEMLLKRKKVI